MSWTRFRALVLAWLIAALAVPIGAIPVAAADATDEATLRAAWADASETLIVLRADVTLTCGGGQPERTSDTSIVINGNGFTLTQPCAGQDGLHAAGAGAVTVRNLAMVGAAGTGDALDAGGGVLVENTAITGFGRSAVMAAGTVTVRGSLLADNAGRGVSTAADASVGGSTVADNGQEGVWSEGEATVTESTIAGNTLTGIDAGGTARVTRSTLAENGLGAGAAGGIVAEGIELTNSTLVGNSAFGAEAGVGIAVVHSTISDHALNLLAEEITLFASAVIAGDQNCSGMVVDAGFNFVDDASCSPAAATDVDPGLGALAQNGGPTPSRLPGEESPLVDAVPAESCTAVTDDQRGVFRPQGPACDIGSVERGLLEPPPAATPTPAASAPTGSATGQLPDTSAATRPDPLPPLVPMLLLVAGAMGAFGARRLTNRG